MKVTAYIQFSNDPNKNLTTFEALSINVAGKAGFVEITTADFIKHLAEDHIDETGLLNYKIALEEVVDFQVKDSLPETKRLMGSSTPAIDKVPDNPKVKRSYNKRVEPPEVVKTTAKQGKKPDTVVKGIVNKKEIKAQDGTFPVVDVLRSLRQKGLISNRASGTIFTVAERSGVAEDWHAFLSQMTKTEWIKQPQVSKGIMDMLPDLYKKSKVELKD